MNTSKVNRIKNGLKITGLFLAAFFIHLGDAEAQRQGGRQGRGANVPDSIDVVQMTKRLSTELALTEVQAADIEKISQDHFAAARAEQKAEKIDRIEKREAQKEAQDAYQTQIKSFLTADQQAKYEEIMAKRKDRRKGKRKGKRRNHDKKDGEGEG